MADVTLTLGADTRAIESAINRLSKKKVKRVVFAMKKGVKKERACGDSFYIF